MIPLIVVTETTTRFSREAFKRVSADAWSEAGAVWHQELLPRHFQTAAAAEYGYAPRTARYMKAKARVQGHQRPLVYKGELERMVTRLRDVTALRARGEGDGGVNVRLSGPRYLHQRQQPRQPNLAEELSAVSKIDADRVAAVIDEFVSDALEGDDDPHDVGQ